MAGVAERLIWKNNKLQITYKKLENAEEEILFPTTLGSHTTWAPGLCRDFPNPKTRQMQVAADAGAADKKRWEASKWSPEVAFQMESCSWARQPVGEASPGTSKQHLILHTVHTDLGATRWTFGLSFTSKTCSAPSPGHRRHGFPGIAHNTAVFGMYFHCSKVQRTRGSSKEFPSCHTKCELLPS